MERDHRTQVESAETTEPRHRSQPLHHEAAQRGFSDTGVIPPVEDAHAVLPPQPSASERAFGHHRGHGQSREEAPDAGLLASQMSRVVHGITVVAPPGTHVGAIDRCVELINLEVGRNLYAQKQLAASRTTIVIIPGNTRMTDVDQFKGLRGDQTFDGRDWSNVRGSGGMQTADGTFAIGVAEENLVAVRGVVSKYTSGYSIGMHELAHAVESKGMTPDQKQRLAQLFAQQQTQDRGDPSTHHDAFTDTYASSNQHEYFAQATNAFFGKNAGAYRATPGTKPIPNHNGRDWLRVKDPDMYAFLVELYETTHDAEGQRVW